MTTPGTKLGFMGIELGQTSEWSPTHALDWALLQRAPHRGCQDMQADARGGQAQDAPR
jgi:1,4-alpha-glucan branching enzyme